jgi:protein SCO1
MKTKSTFLTLSAFIAALASTPSAPGAPACCQQSPAEKVTLSAAALPARSLFQLDAVWTNDAGRELTLRDFRGETLVVTMIFTHCAYACPMLVQDLRKIREQLPPAIRPRVRFVLVTFDTERDSVAVLRTYREAQALDDRWTLLRGSTADTQTLAMLLGIQFRREANGQFGHSNVITVLSADGEVVHQRTGLRGGLEGAAEAIVRVTPCS